MGPGNVWPRPLQLFGFVIGGLTDHDTFAPGGRVTQRPTMFSADLGIDLPRGGVGSWKVEKPFDQCVWGARDPMGPMLFSTDLEIVRRGTTKSTRAQHD